VTETLVERRRRLLRDEIGMIAVDLFASRGFDAVTVDDIAEAAGTSPRTVFRYFASKNEIVLYLARRLDERLIAALDSRPAREGAATALRNAYCSTSHVTPGDHERVLQLARVLAETPTLRAHAHGERVDENDELLAHLAERMSLPADDRRVRVLATSMAAVATVEFHRWADAGGRGDPSVAIGSALGLLESGLGDLDDLPTTHSRDQT
jgi:AcrR family transcriptional regulator